jgi:hypothetical protein
MKIKVISFYCDIENRTYYSDCSKNLKEKLDFFNINHEIKEIQSTGDYMLNCLKKPGFILDELLKNKCAVLWMDIDTDFRCPFSHFDEYNYDVGFCSDTGTIEGVKASPVAFNYTKNSIVFLERWKEECIKATNEKRVELDHDAIKYIILPELNGKIKIKILTENYIDFYNGKYIKSCLSRDFSTKRRVHKKIQEINKYRVTLKQKDFKE